MFNQLCNTPSDINEHLPVLRDLASDCSHVTEMGVRKIVSTWAFAEGLKPGTRLVSIDYKHPKEYGADINDIIEFCSKKGIEFQFVEGDTRKIEIDETDLLFIDTDHFYANLKKELELHGNKTKKYLVFHDVESCKSELIPAINEFIFNNVGEWYISHWFRNNNGLMVLTRV